MNTLPYPNPANHPYRVTGMVVTILSLIFLLIYTSAPYPLTATDWLGAILSPDEEDYRQIIIHYSYLPRLAMAILCGAALAIAGCIMRFVLNNPLASPTTLGVAAGAELGLVTGTLFFSATAGISLYLSAFTGGLLATLLVFAITPRQSYSPLSLILSGMVTTLFLGAVTMMLVLVNEQTLTHLFLWGAGALEQNDWQGVIRLLPFLIIPVILLAGISRALSLLQLGDTVAGSLGAKVVRVRLAALTLSVVMTASVVSEVGIIGFVGLVSPAIARILGARRLPGQIALSACIGALLLLGADLLVQSLSHWMTDVIPTGAVTALLGAPFMLYLLQRRLLGSALSSANTMRQPGKRLPFKPLALLLVLFFVFTVLVSMTWGQSDAGWVFGIDPALLSLRGFRIAVAALAGASLAMAGCVIQRLTGNPMASPEVLGISAGCALAIVLAAAFGLALSRLEQLLFGALGAVAVMALILGFSRKKTASPTHFILIGIAISAMADAIIRLTMASGQEGVKSLLSWLSGSLYLADTMAAGLLIVTLILFGSFTLAFSRWLDVINLGDTVSESLGLSVKATRKVLIVIAAIMTSAATIAIGPLSFIGLLAPHMATSLGQHSARQQLMIAPILGAILLVMADWVGRNLWFPWQFPAGLLASIIGAAYFLNLLRR
ncbi:Fe(3+)-hydroxamate ABC transporter permease FhuB [Grimontia hollisae]|uniref:Fe(3+)-hydroxamate ABC transporter permease FhuB n=1 Tax=Grimontia hollisae TaxID=673 RepID=UPI00165E8C27|nr:Fe(3+)-hydroxamate ABC transporter permease FhuB [Grimontia hollisae]